MQVALKPGKFYSYPHNRVVLTGETHSAIKADEPFILIDYLEEAPTFVMEHIRIKATVLTSEGIVGITKFTLSLLEEIKKEK